MEYLRMALDAGVHGFLEETEAAKLVELAEGKDVLELGSFMGLSAFLMGMTAKSVTCIDTFRANSAGQHQVDECDTLPDFLSAVRRYDHVRYFRAKTEDAIHIPEVSDRQYDLVFIDAMHTYEDVFRDTIDYLPLVKPGGIMAWHDYGHWDFPGTKRAVDELVGEIPAENRVGTLAWKYV